MGRTRRAGRAAAGRSGRFSTEPPQPTRRVAPSPRAQAVARRAAPALRLVERLGLYPRLLAVLPHPPVPDFGSYLPDEHDVVVATYAKSGTNWLLQIVHQVATLGQGSFAHIHDVAPWPDAPGGEPTIAVPLSAPTWQGTPTGRRPVKTHLPRAATPLTDAARYIVVVRDPKDIVVSSYHFVRGMSLGPLMPSVDTWVDLFLSSQGLPMLGGSWPAHVAGWWGERARPNVLVLRYEELIADLSSGIRRVAHLMDVDLDDDVLAQVQAHSTFEAMRALGDRFDIGPFTPLGTAGTRMVRRGAAGGGAELLTDQQRARIDDHCAAALLRLGSDFPYAQCYRGVS